MKMVHRKGLGFIVVFTLIFSVVDLLVRGIGFLDFEDVIYHSIGSDDSLILIYIFLSMFLYYVVYLKYRENRGFDDYEKKPEFTEILFFEGKLKDKRDYKLSVRYTGEIFYDGLNLVRKSEVLPEEKNRFHNFWIFDQTHQMKRTLWFQSEDPPTVVLRDLRIKIDKLISSENDLMNNLYLHLSETLRFGVEKSITINDKLEKVSKKLNLRLSSPTFETEQIISPPLNVKTEVLLNKSWKEDDYTKGTRLTLSHFDNGQVKLDGHEYFYSDERDQEFEYWMTVFKYDVPVFLEILKQVDEPDNVQQVLELCEKKNIEPHFVSWSS